MLRKIYNQILLIYTISLFNLILSYFILFNILTFCPKFYYLILQLEIPTLINFFCGLCENKFLSQKNFSLSLEEIFEKICINRQAERLTKTNASCIGYAMLE